MTGPGYERPDMAAAAGAMQHGADPQYEAWVAAGCRPVIERNPMYARNPKSGRFYDVEPAAPEGVEENALLGLWP